MYFFLFFLFQFIDFIVELVRLWVQIYRNNIWVEDYCINCLNVLFFFQIFLKYNLIIGNNFHNYFLYQNIAYFKKIRNFETINWDPNGGPRLLFRRFHWPEFSCVFLGFPLQLSLFLRSFFLSAPVESTPIERSLYVFWCFCGTKKTKKLQFWCSKIIHFSSTCLFGCQQVEVPPSGPDIGPPSLDLWPSARAEPVECSSHRWFSKSTVPHLNRNR